MKKLSKIVAFLSISALLSSCADSKIINIGGKDVIVEPYGWVDCDAVKNDSVVYQISAGNLIWSIIGSETIVAPIMLTGYSFYEPVRKK